MTDAKKQEFTLRISQANPTGLVVILYEMFLTYTGDGKQALETGDDAAFKRNLDMARKCLSELMESLDFSMEPSGNLLSLYMYVNRELIRARMKKDAACIINGEKIMTSLYETYKKVSEADTSPAVMCNTQTVVAGMTYGRNDIRENLADQGASRGYFV